DYYDVLALPKTASISEVKAAYHRALLLHHPDKQNSREALKQGQPRVDVDTLKRAFETLANTEARAKYDALRAQRSAGPRPAQVVSLEDFTELGDSLETWRYNCRCSGAYTITEGDMERGQHLVGCSSCSEVIWVGYELVEDDEETVNDATA
ncbi:hypothetical protein BDW22DRAFT_1321195, partial [Trametopsis cervina]